MSQSAPTSRGATPPPASKPIPTSFTSSLSAWWNNSSYQEARFSEERLLRRLAIFQPGWGKEHVSEMATAEKRAGEQVVEALETGNGLVATLRNVFIPTPDPTAAPEDPTEEAKVVVKKVEGKLVDYLNTLEISSNANKDSKEAVVVLHGYAAALGFFFRNWENIAQAGAESHRRTFFLDWLGMGLSSRPSSSLLSSPSSASIPARVARAEHFFLSSLESWRESVGVDRMVLVGHSLGGYLASAYAVRYPNRVSSLVLVSPAGIPHGPDTGGPKRKEIGKTGPGGKKWENGKPVEDGAGGKERRMSQEEQGLEEAADAAEMEMEGASAKGEAKDWEKNREQSMFRRNASKLFVWGWEKGLSPFSILRGIGPWGPMLVGKYSSRRFAAQSEEDVRDLHAYIYNTSIMKGSGEYCISHILAPGAYARTPIVDRIGKLKIPVTFLYGDNDWMDVQGGEESVKRLNAQGNTRAKVHVVKNAGHHVYLDNPEDTNKIIADAIDAVKVE